MMTLVKDYAEQIRGVSYKPEDVCEELNDESITLLRANNITDSGLCFDDLVYVRRNKVKDVQKLQKGDVLICTSSGSKALVGKAAYVTKDKDMTFGAFCKVIRPHGVNTDYFQYFFQSPAYRKRISELAAGANINNIRNEHIDGLAFYLPDIPTQQRIADTLDKVSEGIGLCRRMLGELDLMVKAKFVEMFGDVVQNSKQLPIKTLPEISENLDSRRIPITGSVREKGIYPYYGASGIVDYVKDYLFDEDILLISEDGANLLARSTPIAFSAAGKVWVNNHAHVLRFRDRATQCYVENFLNMIDISNYVTGTAQPKLNQAKLNAIPIPTPELASQKQFMEFTRQIKKIKLTSCEVLDKMETERLALMQEYFK